MEDSILPADEEIPDPIFQKEDVELILANMEEIKDINCKKELDKMEKSYYDHIKKVEKSSVDKKEVKKIQTQYDKEIKVLNKKVENGLDTCNQQELIDLKDEIQITGDKFGKLMIDLAKRAQNEKNIKEVEKFTGKKGGTRKKRKRQKIPNIPGAQWVWSASTQNVKDKPKNKTANKNHKRKSRQPHTDRRLSHDITHMRTHTKTYIRMGHSRRSMRLRTDMRHM